MFGNVVRAYRRRFGLTQEDLSARTGVHTRTIAKIETGQIASPRSSTVRLFADAFGLAGADREAFFASAADATPPGQPAQLQADGDWPAAVSHGRGPNQLPADVAAFTGRDEELKRLTAILDHRPSGGARAAVITAIGGTAGVGKTALAIHWAQRMRDRFPDGQLYVNLRGYDPDQPMSTADALAAFLRGLGTASEDIPIDGAERAALYRSVLDGRRMLVLLDNASSVEQVRDLLPGNPSCFALVTSRDSLGGLVARHGAHRVELDLLPLPDAVALLRFLIGGRVDAESTAAHGLAYQCARLPLALRVAAELAAARPESPLATLVDELADQERRLNLLDAGGDPRTAVSAVFSWSYENLPDEPRRMFRLLSLHPGEDLDAYAAAALAGTTPAHACNSLELLVRAHLVHRTSPDRFGMHDLLRVYASGVAKASDSDPDRRECSLALFEHYVDTAYAALAQVHLSDTTSRPEVTTGSAGPELVSRESAQAWLDSELANLVAVAGAATAAGHYKIAPALSTMLGRYTNTRGRHAESLSIHDHALTATRACGDDAAQAQTLAFLGGSYGQQGQHAAAAEVLRQAIELARTSGDLRAEAVAAGNYALAHWHLGNYREAIDWSARAIEVSRACGDSDRATVALMNRGAFLWLRGQCREALSDLTEAVAAFTVTGSTYGIARSFMSICEIHRQLGHYREAIHYGQKALAMAGEIGDSIGEGMALRDLGSVHLVQGDLATAADLLSQAMTRMSSGYPFGENRAVSFLGEVRRRQGRLSEALELQHRAVAFFRRPDHRTGLASALTATALAHIDLGDYSAARTLLEEAVCEAVGSGCRYDEAQAHAVLGDVLAMLDPGRGARSHRARALAIYEEIEAPEAGRVRLLVAPPSEDSN
jgi:tetratricopeptide (TPR) repeat protein/transcriptional regulator with XRE-family HTH domain